MARYRVLNDQEAVNVMGGLINMGYIAHTERQPHGLGWQVVVTGRKEVPTVHDLLTQD